MVRKTANFDIGAVQKRAKTGIPVTVHRYTGTGSGRTDETQAKLRTRALPDSHGRWLAGSWILLRLRAQVFLRELQPGNLLVQLFGEVVVLFVPRFVDPGQIPMFGLTQST